MKGPIVLVHIIQGYLQYVKGHVPNKNMPRRPGVLYTANKLPFVLGLTSIAILVKS